MNRPHILLFGASGMLGSQVHLHKHHDAVMTLPDRSSYDFIAGQSISDCIKRFNPTMVINCAAMTNVDQCEVEQDRCFLVNAYAPGVIAETCEEIGIRCVHISTDFVFDGKLEFPLRYHHTDVAQNPVGTYSEAKLVGETSVLDRCSNSLVIRSSWLFGGNRPTFPDWVENHAGTVIEVPGDRFGSPTYVVDLAKEVMKLAMSHHFGVFHVVNDQSEPVGQIEYAMESKTGLLIDRIHQRDLVERGTWKTLRPRNSALMSDVKMRDWRDALRHYLSLKQSLVTCEC